MKNWFSAKLLPWLATLTLTTAVAPPCDNATERVFELEFHLTQQDVNNFEYSNSLEWQLRYTNDSNNTMVEIANGMAFDYYPPEDESTSGRRKIDLDILQDQMPEVRCIPKSQCVEFDVRGLTADQFTARVDGNPIPASAYDIREFYFFDATEQSLLLFTTRLGGDEELCDPPVCGDEEELLEWTIWANDAGYSLDWWLTTTGQEKFVARCPRSQYESRGCEYQDDRLYKEYRCLDRNQNYRLVFYSEFAGYFQREPAYNKPQIDVNYGGELLDSFNYPFKSIAIGDSTECQGEALFELFAEQTVFHQLGQAITPYQLYEQVGNEGRKLLLNGTIGEEDSVHYNWKCVSPYSCLIFAMDRDLSFDEYRVDSFITVDNVIYRDAKVDYSVPNRTEYRMIGPGCSNTGKDFSATTDAEYCGKYEVLMELEFKIREEDLGLIDVNWDITLFEEGYGDWIDSLVRNYDVLEPISLVNRTYRYQRCLSVRQCHVMGIAAQIDSYDETGSSISNDNQTELLNEEDIHSTVTAKVDGNVLLHRSIPIDAHHDRFAIELNEACSDPTLSRGKIVAAVIGSVTGFAVIVYGVYKVFVHSKKMPENKEKTDEND